MKTLSIILVLSILGCQSDDALSPTNVQKLEGEKEAQSEFFIAPNGDDDADCTFENPCRTVTHVITKTPEGGTINVRGGQYDESEIWIRNIATAEDRRLVIQAYQNEDPLFRNGNRHVIVENSYVTIKGLSFTNGKFIAVVNGHHGAHIIGNRIFGSGFSWAAISVEGSFSIVQDNTISLEGNTVGTQGHGIYLAAGIDNRIVGNTVSGMTGYGIHCFDQPRSGDTAPRYIEDVIIAYNTCFNSRERAGIIVAAQATTQASQVHVYRNIVYDCAGNGITMIDQVHNSAILNNTIYNINTNGIRADGEDGIYVGMNTYGIRVANNIVLMNRADGHHVAVENAEMVAGHNNLYWPGSPRLLNFNDQNSINADPLFNNAAAHDFNLLEGSPAIDAGRDVGLPYWGSAIDIGALEFKPTGTGVR